MKKLTTLETTILKIIIAESFGEYSAWFSGIVKKSGKTENVIKGVIGSLTAKEVVVTEDDEVNKGEVCVFALYEDGGFTELVSFGWDTFKSEDDVFDAVINGKNNIQS